MRLDASKHVQRTTGVKGPLCRVLITDFLIETRRLIDGGSVETATLHREPENTTVEDQGHYLYGRNKLWLWTGTTLLVLCIARTSDLLRIMYFRMNIT